MKILHTSDLHIGISLFGEDMLPYQEKIGESLCAAAVECGADCMIMRAMCMTAPLLRAKR